MVAHLFVRVLALCGAATAAHLSSGDLASATLLNLNDIVKTTHASFDSDFPHHRWSEFEQQLQMNLQHYKNSTASTAYETLPGQARCKVAQIPEDAMLATKTNEVTPFKGGSSVSLKGMSLVDKVNAQLAKARGPAAAMVPGISMIAKAALTQVKSVLQTVAAVVATRVPPMVPPPAWNNRPFVCMPMVTGHNCFGAVLYPITIGDFILADLSDAAIGGVISSFPSYYRSKIGATDEGTYQRCFSSYMSMQCANAFPICTNPQGSQEMAPGMGRAPMCFLHCVATLIACPGMWVDDLEDICTNVSAPPMCAFATYAKAAPSQLRSFDESQASNMNCPSA